MKPFESSYAKLRQAREHIKTFHAQFTSDYEAKTPTTEIRLERRRPDGVIIADLIVTQVPDISPELGLILGDVTSNLRAGLDHAVWRLVRMWGAQLTTRQERQICFPMTNRPRVFIDKGDGFTRCVRGVPIPHYRALFERYQPYKRTYKGRAMRLLRDISDRDKHRVAVLSYPAPSRLRLRVIATDCQIIGREPPPTRFRRLQKGAPLARFYLLPTGSNPDVHMEGNSRLSPALDGKHTAWDSLLLMAWVCHEAVQEIEHAALGHVPLPPKGPPHWGGS